MAHDQNDCFNVRMSHGGDVPLTACGVCLTMFYGQDGECPTCELRSRVAALEALVGCLATDGK